MLIFGGYDYEAVNFEAQTYGSASLFSALCLAHIKTLFTALKGDMYTYDFDNMSILGQSWQAVNYSDPTGPRPKPRMLHTALYRDGGTMILHHAGLSIFYSFFAGVGNAGLLVIQGGMPLAQYKGDKTTIYYACAANDMWEFDLVPLLWS